MTDKKYFTLINGKSIRLTSEKKIIPQDAFSKLLNADDVVLAAMADAVEYKKEVTSECEELKEQAIQEGFWKGFEEWTDLLTNLEQEIEKTSEEMMQFITPIILKAARKIVATELSLNKNAIIDIVKSTLLSVAQHKRIIIYINKADYETLNKNKQEIMSIFESTPSLSLRERDDIEPGGCVIETEGGIINAQVQDRWNTIESFFHSLGNKLTFPKKMKPNTVESDVEKTGEE